MKISIHTIITFYCALLFTSSLVQAQTGVFTVLVPEGIEGGSFYGSAVAISEDYIAVSDNPSDLRAVYIFKKEGDAWVEDTVIEQYEGDDNDDFGARLDFAGNFLFISCFDYNQETGRVYVYKNEGGVWIEQPVLAPDGPSQKFGQSVSVDGDYLMIGATLYGNPSPGATYMYKLIDDVWTFQQLIAPDVDNFEQFGDSGSDLEGEYAAMVSHLRERVHIYKREGETWELEQILEDDFDTDNSTNGSFGKNVLFYEDKLLVGYLKDDVAGEDKGSIIIYQREGSEWIFKDKIIPEALIPGGRFGEVMSISEKTLAVGIQSGGVTLFIRKGDKWEYQNKYTSGETSLGDKLELYDNQLVISESSSDVVANNRGTAYIYNIPTLYPTTSEILCNSNGTVDPTDDYLEFDLTCIAKDYPTTTALLFNADYDASPAEFGFDTTVPITLSEGSASADTIFLKAREALDSQHFYYIEIVSPGTCSPLTSSVHDLTDNDFVEVGPNPFLSEVTFDFTKINDIDNKLLLLTNSQGKEIYRESIITKNEVHVDLSRFSAGIFVWQLQNSKTGITTAAGQLVKK